MTVSVIWGDIKAKVVEVEQKIIQEATKFFSEAPVEKVEAEVKAEITKIEEELKPAVLPVIQATLETTDKVETVSL